MHKETGIAIIGAGNIAEVHAQAIQTTPGAKLVAVHSRSTENGEAFARKYGCVYESTLESLLARKDVQGVAITTPSGTHAALGIKAAQAGKHVLCEKPMDITVERIESLISVCEENKVILGAIFQARFGKNAQATKRAVDAGRFGKLVQCSAFVPWYRSEEYYAHSGWRGTWEWDGGGALMNQSIHAVDLLLWFAGDVEEVSAKIQTRVHDIEVEDNAVAWLKFKNGAIGVIQASTACYPGEPRRIEIKGDQGAVTLLDDRPTLWKFQKEESEDQEVQQRDSDEIKSGASDPKAISIAGHQRQYADFIISIQEGGSPALPGSEGIRAVRLIQAIYASSKTGSIVRL